VIDPETKCHSHHLLSDPMGAHARFNVSLVELVGCGAGRNRLLMYAWLPQCPLNVQAIGLGAFVGVPGLEGSAPIAPVAPPPALLASRPMRGVLVPVLSRFCSAPRVE